MNKPVVLLVLDGWGIAPPGPGNALSLAHLPNFINYRNTYPHTQLIASGDGVGLPPGEDGNTETGHLNLGAGRVVYQDLPRINMAVADGSFSKNEAFLGAFRYAESHNSNIHLMGLVSDGMVHASRTHLYALLELAKSLGKNVYIHVFSDGRDSPPNAGLRFIQELEDKCKELGTGKIASIIGRYYAMDRDRRWERTEKAYNVLTGVGGATANSAKEAIEKAYKGGITDEFIEPTMIVDETGKPLPRINNHDAVIFFNFRIDRPRQITKALVLDEFESHTGKVFDPYTVNYYHKHVMDSEDDSRMRPFTRKVIVKNLYFVSMTEYERNLPVTVAFPPLVFKSPFGRVLSDNNLRQLRMSETEKERFVTYYFNGLREEPFPGEDRLIIPSQKVATYDLSPAMSARQITEKLLDRISSGVYSFILVNFANPDMLGHTGNIKAAIDGVEVVDECLGKIIPAVLAMDGSILITADHGNVEEMLGPEGEVDTEHSTYPVPLLIIDKRLENKSLTLPHGKLADVAPTILYMLGIEIPSVMTGKNLLIDVLK